MSFFFICNAFLFYFILFFPFFFFLFHHTFCWDTTTFTFTSFLLPSIKAPIKKSPLVFLSPCQLEHGGFWICFWLLSLLNTYSFAVTTNFSSFPISVLFFFYFSLVLLAAFSCSLIWLDFILACHIPWSRGTVSGYVCKFKWMVKTWPNL